MSGFVIVLYRLTFYDLIIEIKPYDECNYSVIIVNGIKL